MKQAKKDIKRKVLNKAQVFKDSTYRPTQGNVTQNNPVK